MTFYIQSRCVIAWYENLKTQNPGKKLGTYIFPNQMQAHHPLGVKGERL